MQRVCAAACRKFCSECNGTGIRVRNSNGGVPHGIAGVSKKATSACARLPLARRFSRASSLRQGIALFFSVEVLLTARKSENTVRSVSFRARTRSELEHGRRSPRTWQIPSLGAALAQRRCDMAKHAKSARKYRRAIMACVNFGTPRCTARGVARERFSVFARNVRNFAERA